MFKSTLSRVWLVLALTVAAVAAGVLVIGSSAASARKAPTEIRVVTVDVGPGGGSDVPPQGDSVGDSDTFTSVGSDAKTGRRLGSAEAACTIFEIAKPGGYGPPVRNATYHCVSIVRLRGAELTLSGRVHFDAQGKSDNEPVAILGGTGLYAGARGWATGKRLSDGKTLTVLHFVR